MPLLDHFRPPLHPDRHWETVHTAWATAMMSRLNRRWLPRSYFAETHVSLSRSVEIDVPTWERPSSAAATGSGTGVAVAEPSVWAPPAPPLRLTVDFADDIEVRVLGGEGGAQLVGAVELVSPANKDRLSHREAFVAKCVSLWQRRVGLVVVDVVTVRSANLHNELMAQTGQASDARLPSEAAIYAVSYRPVRTADGDRVECWPERLTVGERLPILPLALRDGPTVPLELEETYAEMRESCRL